MKLNPLFIALFAFSFAIMIGSLWEILEFVIDSLFSSNMQKSGLLDTMGDLIVNFVGAILISLLGYFYIIRKGSFFKISSLKKNRFK